MSDQYEGDTDRITTLDELELSIHFIISDDPIRSIEEYEIHAGMADVIEIPERLVETTKTVTGVDIRSQEVRCGAEIRIVEPGGDWDE